MDVSLPAALAAVGDRLSMSTESDSSNSQDNQEEAWNPGFLRTSCVLRESQQLPSTTASPPAMDKKHAASREPSCRSTLGREDLSKELKSKVMEGGEQERHHLPLILGETTRDDPCVRGSRVGSNLTNRGEKLSSKTNSFSQISATCIPGSSLQQYGLDFCTRDPERPLSVCCDQSLSTSSLSTTSVDPTSASRPLHQRGVEGPAGSPESCPASHVTTSHAPSSFVPETETPARSAPAFRHAKLSDPDMGIGDEFFCEDADNIHRRIPRSNLASSLDCVAGVEHSFNVTRKNLAHSPSNIGPGSQRGENKEMQEEIDQKTDSCFRDGGYPSEEAPKAISLLLNQTDGTKNDSSFSPVESSPSSVSPCERELVEANPPGNGLAVADESKAGSTTVSEGNQSFSEIWQDWLVMSRKLFGSGRAAVYVQQKRLEGDIPAGREGLKEGSESSCSSDSSCAQQHGQQSRRPYSLPRGEDSADRHDRAATCDPKAKGEHGDGSSVNEMRQLLDLGRIATCDREEQCRQPAEMLDTKVFPADVQGPAESLGDKETGGQNNTEDRCVQKVVISYRKFKRLRSKVPPSMACFFTAPLYAEFLRDFSGHVHCQSVASACLTAAFNRFIRLKLGRFAELCHERYYFSQKGFRAMLREWAEDPLQVALVALKQEDAFNHPGILAFFIRYVTERLFFMLDSERTGRVSVEQLLNLDEFQKLVDVLYKPLGAAPPDCPQQLRPQFCFEIFSFLKEYEFVLSKQVVTWLLDALRTHICEQTYHVTSAVVDRLFTLLPATRIVHDTFVVANGRLTSFSSRCETGPEEPEGIRPLYCGAQPGRDHEDARSKLRSVEDTQLLPEDERPEKGHCSASPQPEAVTCPEGLSPILSKASSRVESRAEAEAGRLCVPLGSPTEPSSAGERQEENEGDGGEERTHRHSKKADLEEARGHRKRNNVSEANRGRGYAGTRTEEEPLWPECHIPRNGSRDAREGVRLEEIDGESVPLGSGESTSGNRGQDTSSILELEELFDFLFTLEITSNVWSGEPARMRPLDPFSIRSALRFSWDLLDLDRKGSIGLSELRHFWKAVALDLTVSQAFPCIEDLLEGSVELELLDRLRPRAKMFITKDEFINSHTEARLLTMYLFSPTFFLLFDQREQIQGAPFLPGFCPPAEG